MTVTVIIPAYNAAKTIKRTLASVLAQTFPDFEVLVIDDGSQDETAEFVLSNQDQRIHLHRHAGNQGAASARNTGIRLAQGELIAFLDADDVWAADKLAVQVSFMQENPQAGASVTSFFYETEEGPSVEILRKPASWIEDFSKGCAVAPGTTLMVRKLCYEVVGEYDESMPRHEDFDWLLRFVQKFDLGVVQRPLATVYRSGQPCGEKIGAVNEIIVKRYQDLFYSLGRFKGSQAVGKRWLETSIHYFMYGNRRMGFSYLWRAVKENPFQRATMYLRIIDYALGVRMFPAVKKGILRTRRFLVTRKGQKAQQDPSGMAAAKPTPAAPGVAMQPAGKPILIFSPSLAAGGAERAVVNLARAFMERGQPVQLVLAQAKGEFLADLPEGVPVRDLGQAHVTRALPALRRILRAERPDILLSAQTHANLVALWAVKLARVRTKLIISEHSTKSVNAAFSNYKDTLLTLLARVFYPAADAIVAVSRGAAEDLVRTIGLRPGIVHVIYNPIVTPALLEKAGQEPDHPWTAPGSPALVLAAGRLTAAKDYPTLLRAFARARQQRKLHLLILGEGEKRVELETLVKALGLEEDAQMPGFVQNPYAYMGRASVFVLCSAWEGLPSVLVEALACGAPVVSTDCKSGPTEILDHGRYGSLVPVGDDEKMSLEILKAIDSQPDKKSLRMRGETFSAERAAEAYLALFRSLMSENE